MASLLPFISDILPMIMPATTQITRAKDLEPSHPTVEGPIVYRPAVVGQCDRMCTSASKWVSNISIKDAIIYAVSGTGILVVKEGFEGELHRHELTPGDFAFVPAWTEHQFCNETDSDTVYLIIQGGPRPAAVNLTDWGGQVIPQT
ncbi:hypothetical protein S7711_07513 [Stachybotrys chartarum IBT 7711]|uniref:Cupin type-2 domain-containing protein n=1 Tax=Stachybotrys chartarum (strain CBS 109288 / IBT 7711) TaxID=1280523 RepID=A0A084AK51_STACB|nr:hypothetical protein S7711_07513 [Stachybotrys chartarum IBT 7711]KFA54171.1 hypothetical protein S40293_06285 [Stachybotrys chartarum IBT 40293]